MRSKMRDDKWNSAGILQLLILIPDIDSTPFLSFLYTGACFALIQNE